jgi:uncharacterized protein
VRHLITLLVVCLLSLSGARAAPSFPVLTGRIVDTAQLLSPTQEQTLSANLEAFEQKTKHQLVVVTLPSLQGYAIEDYGYQLGRHWGIGRKGANDGVLLIVAPNEREMRIEVGYGLEGDLTDALSSRIIQSVILPEFKRGDMAKGITNGTRAIIGVLGGEPYALPAYDRSASDDELPVWVIVLVILFIFFMRYRFGVQVAPVGHYGSGWRSTSHYGGGGGFGGGGFRGGGGSFGGGGGSGRW